MNNALGMYVLDGLTDLPNKDNTGPLSEHKLILDHAVKELSTSDPE